MKNKKITALILTAALGAASIPAADKNAAAILACPGIPLITAQAAASPSAATLAKAVKKVYGENYLPEYMLDKTEIKDRYGVASSLYASVYAEIPLISAHVDELVIFKAKNAASKKKIVNAVKKYQDAYKKDTMQYPMNLLKIQASRVYTNGNYVCFFMLGQISSSIEQTGTDEDIIKAYQKQNNKAVSAVKKKLK